MEIEKRKIYLKRKEKVTKEKEISQTERSKSGKNNSCK